MHMLCSKCEKSMWLGYIQPTIDVYCANCGKLLISRAAAVSIHNPAHTQAGVVALPVTEKGNE
jgi:hypothetical protein